jgi:N-acyl-D-aspartate/D-glutamate deacylase
MNIFLMTEDDVRYIIRHPLSMIGSDAIPSTGNPHPRFYGTFPRVLAKYVREEQLISLQEGIRKMTSLPAQKLGLRDRGVLREGAWADLVVFNPDTVADKATFTEPAQYPDGIDCVLVNGTVAVRQGQYIGSLNGRTLRRGQ